jgi:Protein of unknown function (DUF3592)
VFAAHKEVDMQAGLLFGLAFVAIGVVIFFLGLRDLRLAKASAGWPATQGAITATRIRVDDRGESSESYHPEITYTYAVMGASYEGSRRIIGATRGYSSRRRAEAFLEAYPVGRQVTVYYDPQKPREAVLEAGTTRGAIGTLIISAVFALIGLIAVGASLAR